MLVVGCEQAAIRRRQRTLLVTGTAIARARWLGTFGQLKFEVPRARLDTSEGKTTEWKSHTLGAYQRRTLAADALIAGCYLSGTNTRRVRRAHHYRHRATARGV